MIKNQWYAVLHSKQVKKHKPLGIKRMGERMIFWREESGEVVCMRDLCPHRGAALSLGKQSPKTIACPFHGFEFDKDGECVKIPAFGEETPPLKNMNVQTYPTHEDHDFIFIFWGDQKPTALPPFFPDLTDDFSYGEIVDHWKTHYSRAIENQLDVVHLPFVHASTIGRGNKTVVNGPIYEWTEVGEQNAPMLNIWVKNEVDQGQTYQKEEDMDPVSPPPQLQFIYGNIWHNWIADDIRVFLAFVPVDDENTLMYLRFYQRFMKIPLLKQAINFFGSIANLVIADQDQGVVESQRPLKSGLKIGEKPIYGDRPIVAYRRKRDELQKLAENS